MYLCPLNIEQVTLSSLNRHAVATLADVGLPKVGWCYVGWCVSLCL